MRGSDLEACGDFGVVADLPYINFKDAFLPEVEWALEAFGVRDFLGVLGVLPALTPSDFLRGFGLVVVSNEEGRGFLGEATTGEEADGEVRKASMLDWERVRLRERGEGEGSGSSTEAGGGPRTNLSTNSSCDRQRKSVCGCGTCKCTPYMRIQVSIAYTLALYNARQRPRQ